MNEVLSMRYIALLLAFFIALTVFPHSSSAEEYNTTAKAAAVLELGSNSVLYSENAHEKLPMASTTKVMTAITAIERCSLDEIITTADKAYGVEGSSIYLLKNEQISMRDLLYGLMLRSGNDAAVAIACAVGGSIEGFAELMNKKAAEIGANNTHFANPHGLPAENHYTTAYDLALICSYALKNTTFREIVSTQYYTAETGEVKRTMMNKNKLLFQYEGTIGIKTGYTKAAGKCLTFAAEREGLTVVGVVLNCPDMFNESMRLMDYCFDTYRMYTIIKSGMRVARVQPDNSDSLCSLVTADNVSVPVKKSDGASFSTKVYITEKLRAPIRAGTVCGKLLVYKGDTLVTEILLFAAENVSANRFGFYLQRVVNALSE